MSQSISSIYLHIIFATKYRTEFINNDINKELHPFIVDGLSELGSYTCAIYANPEHIHILCTLPRTITVANLIYKIKAPSSQWLKKKGISGFRWQNGYNALSVSKSVVPVIEKYIHNQPEHHKKQSFRNELLGFLNDHEIDFDEDYLWD